jgi:acyl-CoA thioester hydrolase
MDSSKFQHKTVVRVRNYEVDWQGIVHNANYLLFFEVGRLEYLKHIGMTIDFQTIQRDSRVVLVRNEIDYKSPARFDDTLDVYTRISYIRNTSFAFEGIIGEQQTGRLVARNLAIHVWLDPRTGMPKTVDDDFRRRIQKMEGEHVAIVGPSLFT